MITQLELSLTKVAHLPAVAERIAVETEPPIRGTTLLEADITLAWIVFNIISRPVQEDAVGKVTVVVAPLLTIIQFSVEATEKSALLVTGAFR
jgi:hypothetical protein